MSPLSLKAVLLATAVLPVASPATIPPVKPSPPRCRYLPQDAGWPSVATWDRLNQTVGGRLIRGVPLGQPCHGIHADGGKCAQVQSEWTSLPPFIADPVNVMSPYWTNNSCSPFAPADAACGLGNLAQYALDVRGAADAVRGIRFARDHNLRLTIKNTGHDFLGRSAGAGSLALWTHHLKDMTFLPAYRSAAYAGPAVRIGAGVEYGDVLPAAAARGLRVVGGSCPSVGVAGGFSQGGGHGPLGSAYGLGADQVLEWEVVTAAGEHVVASPTSHPRLFWALAGGGAGNYAVVLSVTVRAHRDGPVAGAGFAFANDGDDAVFWDAVAAWLRHLVVLSDGVEGGGISAVFAITARSFELEFATLPDPDADADVSSSADRLDAALAPFLADLARLNVSLGASYASDVHPDFAQHYARWAAQPYDSNITLGGRLIPRAVVRDEAVGLPAVVAALRGIARGGAKIISVAANFARGGGGGTPVPDNAVLPAWREALFTTSFARSLPVDAGWDGLREDLRQLNAWQDSLRAVTPGGGTYMNEATWDNPQWKQDYFGANYEALLAVKETYDPDHVFWANAAVGSDTYWKVAEDQRLCRV